MGSPLAIRALTVIQPWAHLIAHGPKRIENRVWEPPRVLVGAFLAIHAGKRVDPECWQGADELAAFAQIKHPVLEGLVDAEDLDARTGGNKHRAKYAAAAVPYGAVVAVARLAGVVRASTDPWFCGPVGWQLADVVALPAPVACGGAQGLWELGPELLDQVRAQWKAARDVR